MLLTLGVAAAAADAIRINCGWGTTLTASDGTEWGWDRSFVGGQIVRDQFYFGPDFRIFGSARVGRTGDFRYQLATANGDYVIRFKFAELERRSAGQRIFDVLVNGILVLERYDIAAKVGMRRPVDESVTVRVTSGEIRIDFIGIVGRGSVSAIEILLVETPPPGGAPSGPQFFVSPAGTAGGDGSEARPWDLATALNHPAGVKPGATIWLRGGTYGNGIGNFVSHLTGTASEPIVVRQYPGERAALNGSLLIYAPYTWFWGFEVMRNPRLNESDCIDTYQGSKGTRLINLVIHDCGSNGVGYWRWAKESEIYGSLIYYNGYAGARGHGHGIYVQNDNLAGGKTIEDNIIFKGMATGIHAYGSSSAGLRNIRMRGNVVFEPGTLYGPRIDSILVTVGSGSEDITVEENYVYMRPDLNDGYTRFGWVWSGVEKNLIARNNYFIGGLTASELWNWNDLEFTGNTVYSHSMLILILNHLEGQPLSRYNIGRNRYFGSGIFRYQGRNRNFSFMQSLGIDQNSEFTPGRPTGTWTFVRPNKYERGRANIVVYNWDMQSSVTVNLAEVLTPGIRFEVRDVQNYFGGAVVTGIYQGGSIAIPMTRMTVSEPIGSVPRMPHHTGPEFGTFVVLPLP
ncbi:MAG: malectin domain-containing carbohydrate-binding protein [Bryobacteraceae bacterium]